MSAAESIKYRWYETDSKVVVEVPIKNANEEDVTVNYVAEMLAAFIKLPNDEIYSLQLNLRHPILPDQCSFKMRATKVEFHLPKVMHSRWEKLEKEDKPKPNAAAAAVKPKNWDQVVKDNLNEKEEENSINALFSKIYEEGDADQRRAMMKSFTESGGTVLSTNWDEVGKKKVEVKPPEGVEYKSWN